MNTLSAVLARANISVPDATIADLEVPIISGPQRQGDVLIVPRAPLGAAELDEFTTVPAKGVPVVRGEATGNTHLLQPDPGCTISYRRHDNTTSADLTLGVLDVPEGAVAWLIHTDEHGANGIGPGTYVMKGKREQADELRRIAD